MAIFHSIHRVMKAEKILKQARLDILLIPVPRQLSSDCGLAIRFPEEARSDVEAALEAAGVSLSEIWLKSAGNYSQIL